ncbi:MAG: aminoacyl-tRNA hydrolase [Propionibacteriaceae bacterium]|jgi:PTH1 family peptidyl-tRNA hydrolase|nr:aminoacyl-tRNA hydrolase [Propionibacteriaceae bacterium]
MSEQTVALGPWLVVGLGNPGPNYAGQRHNAGRMVVDELASRAGGKFSSSALKRFEALATRVSDAGIGVPSPSAVKAILLKSRTYMNESGIAVKNAAAFFGVKPGQIIVIHDELDIDFGQLRLKLGGGDNGHNGLKSIRAHLKTGDFHRIRFGIGRPNGHQDPAAFVLQQFSANERKDLPFEVDRAADAALDLVANGLAHAQNGYNS